MTVSPLRMPLSAHNRRRYVFHSSHDDASTVFKTVKDKPIATTKSNESRKLARANPISDEESPRFLSTLAERRREDEEPVEAPAPVFRRRTSWLNDSSEMDALWTLKRANPVFDSDDEDELQDEYASPPKRSRVQTLDWDQLWSSDEEPMLSSP